MKRALKITTLLLLFAAQAKAAKLTPDQFSYLGSFQPPENQGAGKTETWKFGTTGLTLIPDCMGFPDPSPDDGFPGCLGAFGNPNGFQFGVFDIVQPGRQSKQVVPFYELGAPIVDQQLGRKASRYFDVLYDKDTGHCRLWWTYGTWYAGVQSNPPFLGYSSCDPDRPNPQGIWGFGQGKSTANDSDPFHTAKMYQGLSLIPDRIANRYFEGKRMMLGLSRRSGTRGGSQGPSLYVRPLEAPPLSDDMRLQDATPLVWYELTGFMEWYDKPQMDGPVVHWWATSKAQGAEFIRIGKSQAVVLPWKEPIINPEDYPCSDPWAYRDNDPKTPEPCEVPVCWYGVPSCRQGPAEHQQPSFWDTQRDGKSMPKDCRLSDPCGGGTGPHCLSIKPFLIFYNIGKLGRVYTKELKHQKPQPYAKMPLESFWGSSGSCSPDIEGTTYSFEDQLLFVSRGGGSPSIHVFRIEELLDQNETEQP